MCTEVTDCIQTQTRYRDEDRNTVGEDMLYILVRDRRTFMLFLILESKLMDL